MSKQFKGSDKKLYVRPVYNHIINGDSKHENYFLFGTSTVDYSLPLDANSSSMGTVVLCNPFKSKEEREWLESELGFSLNHLAKEDNFWANRIVKLSKVTKILDLSKPYDYIDYLILLANKEFIANGGDEKLRKKTYKFVIEDEDFDTERDALTLDKKAEAYAKYNELIQDKNKMLNFLKVYGASVSRDSKESFLKKKIGTIIDEDPRKFLKIITDVSYDMKLLIDEFVEYKVITKQGKLYFLQGGDALCEDGEVSTIENVVAFLEKPKNDNLFESLKLQLSKKKNK